MYLLLALNLAMNSEILAVMRENRPKTRLWWFGPSQAQAGLYSHLIWFEA